MGPRVRELARAKGSRLVTLSVILLEDGTFSASISSWEIGGPGRDMYYLDGGKQDGTLAPPALSALAVAAQQALDEWWAGRLR